MARGRVAEATVTPPIIAGNVTVRASVSVVYEIAPEGTEAREGTQ